MPGIVHDLFSIFITLRQDFRVMVMEKVMLVSWFGLSSLVKNFFCCLNSHSVVCCGCTDYSHNFCGCSRCLSVSAQILVKMHYNF